jgi:hypothetical protein
MSDVTVAPDGGGAPPAASSEVVINENPVASPNPVGSQAPDKPVDHADARRESIKAAFDRANNPQPKAERPKPKVEPAEAKAGHNNPPEETEKLNLKKRPDDQPRGDQPRDRGRFAPRQQDVNQQAAQDAGTRPAAKQLPEGTPFRDPPPRMAEHAKIEWHAAPESVRGEFHRLVKEADGIYRQYRGDHEAMQPIRHFHQMAQQHGTTLERALTNYVNMETKLRADPIGGLDVIVNNLNLRDPSDGSKIDLRRIAYHILSQSPEQLKMLQQGNAQTAASHQIGALHQEIAGLKNHLHQMHTQQQFVYTRNQVDQFADSHPRFDELGAQIEQELKFGFDLETAYRRAEALSPATHAAQTRAPSAQTRTADRSISGNPDVAPSNGASRTKKPVGRREAISNAFRANGIA